jgi:hypothetical protein
MENPMKFAKLKNFASLATFAAIEPFLKKAAINANVIDTAFESADSVYLARVVSDEYCDASSEDAMQVTTFKERSDESAVYISPRRNSIFSGQLDDVVALLKAGYKLYAVEEYEHSDISVKLASSSPIRSAKAILTGSFRDGVKLSCRWDSSFAFFAQPKSWSKPSPEFFSEFSNWLNGYSFSYEVIKATIQGVNDEGDSTFEIEVVDQCTGYYSTESAEASALESLEAICKHLEAVPA